MAEPLSLGLQLTSSPSALLSLLGGLALVVAVLLVCVFWGIAFVRGSV